MRVSEIQPSQNKFSSSLVDAHHNKVVNMLLVLLLRHPVQLESIKRRGHSLVNVEKTCLSDFHHEDSIFCDKRDGYHTQGSVESNRGGGHKSNVLLGCIPERGGCDGH